MIKTTRIIGKYICIATGTILLVSVLIGLTQTVLRACSVFSLSTENEAVYGQNLDWHTPFPGHVVVNKRGIKKTILPWKGHWPEQANTEAVFWISRYGSVTFTCYGRDFIEGGMNEAGLTVDEASLVAAYPPRDDRPGVSCPQWMQYQLDNFATVDEVLAHLEDLRPDGEGWHYLIADRSGACAVIEYEKGKPLVYTGEAVEVCAITNTTHKQALNHIPLDVAFGGEVDIASGNDSYGRFVRMVALFVDYTIDANRVLVNTVLGAGKKDPEIIKKLKLRGLTFDDALELIAQNPTEFGK